MNLKGQDVWVTAQGVRELQAAQRGKFTACKLPAMHHGSFIPILYMPVFSFLAFEHWFKNSSADVKMLVTVHEHV